MQMRNEDRTRLLALLWSELAFVTMPAGTRTDHANAMMDLLEQLDVDASDYDPDGFDERVKASAPAAQGPTARIVAGQIRAVFGYTLKVNWAGYLAINQWILSGGGSAVALSSGRWVGW